VQLFIAFDQLIMIRGLVPPIPKWINGIGVSAGRLKPTGS
jgi:hypothetical protein